MHDDDGDDEDGDDENVSDDDDGDDHLEKVELLPHDGVHLLSDLVLHLQPLLTPEKAYLHYHGKFCHLSPVW